MLGSKYGNPEESRQQSSSTSLAEFGLRDTRSGSEHGTSEGNMLQTSTSSGNTQCDICLEMHDRTKCQFFDLEPIPPHEKVIRPYKEECEICHEEHTTFQCEQFRGLMAGKRSFSDDDEPIASLSPSPERENAESEAASWNYNLCLVCCKEHIGEMCPYIISLPQHADIGPYYDIHCERCDEVIDNTLECPYCKMVVPGYLAQKCCDSCYKLKSFYCCTEGQQALLSAEHGSLGTISANRWVHGATTTR